MEISFLGLKVFEVSMKQLWVHFPRVPRKLSLRPKIDRWNSNVIATKLVWQLIPKKLLYTGIKYVWADFPTLSVECRQRERHSSCYTVTYHVTITLPFSKSRKNVFLKFRVKVPFFVRLVEYWIALDFKVITPKPKQNEKWLSTFKWNRPKKIDI